MKKVPDRVCPTIRVNQLILIPPERLQLNSIYNTPVDIPIPSAHGPPLPVQVRLLSAKGRPGMPGQNDYAETSVSDSLIIHCHGGGFVAQSSQSHETVVRFITKIIMFYIICSLSVNSTCVIGRLLWIYPSFRLTTPWHQSIPFLANCKKYSSFTHGSNAIRA